ncbi:MAG: hypothetical protein MJ003_04485 [Paludibacteraceae bacterium]|nr:hypothetical protein [Paludibacteraceae bacterium]
MGVSALETDVNIDSIKAAVKAEKKEKIKQEWNTHFKFYGFVRNYLTYDSRQGYAANEGLYYFVPKDVLLNQYGQDLNATPEFRYLNITTRVGVNMFDYKYKHTYFTARIECDFAFSIAATAAVALRLRHACFTMTWKDLKMYKDKTAEVSLLMGQYWHPISIGYADIMSFETGSPFDVANRAPQITMDATLNRKFTITGSLIAQFQYASTGPNGPSWNYQKYALTPEAFVAFTYFNKGVTARAGVNVTSIKPRKSGLDANGVEVLVNDRITTFCPYLFLEYKYKDLVLSAKTAYGQAGEQINLMSGYGVSKMNPDGSWEYTPMQSSATWGYIQYGKKYIGSVFGGYFKNFGTTTSMVDTDPKHFFVNPFCDPGLMAAWRIIPSFKVKLGNFLFGVEYHYTAAQYGKNVNNYGLATTDLHWVGNHRVLAMFQYEW